MPVTAQVGGAIRDNDEMPDAGFDPRITPGANVRLASLIRLDRVHGRDFVEWTCWHGSTVDQ